MPASKLAVVILAAGKGTRMRSALPKVLHPLGGMPMIERVLRTAKALADKVIVVTAPESEDVRASLGELGVDFAIQRQQRGTGDALAAAVPHLPADCSRVLVLCGDVPLLTRATLDDLLAHTPTEGVGLVTAQFPDPSGLGRILRDVNGGVTAIVEERDATAAERQITEINAGIYLLPAVRLEEWLAALEADNAQAEYYLTDVVRFAVAAELPVNALLCVDRAEVSGVNDRLQLAELERVLQRRQADALMREGVSLLDPARIDIRGELEAGRDCVIDVNCVFVGKVVLGRRVVIGAHCVIEDAEIDDDAVIAPFTHISGAHVGAGARVGPFARLREGTDLGEGTRVGNFVETKKTRLGAGSKANHLAYLGDATLGADCNVGAGTITCNYDGVDKHPTVLGNGVFVGSNSTLVAPLVLGEAAYVAAGSTITSDVPADALGVGRSRQRNIKSWMSPRKRGSKV